MWGIEASKSFTDLQRTISNAIKRLLDRADKTDADVALLQPQIDTLVSRVTTAESDITNLELKQDKQKLIQIVATQRTTKTTAGDAEVVASDAPGAALNTWVSRKLNTFSRTKDASDYFTFDATNNRINILKTGTYLVSYESHAHRTNFWNLMAEYLPPTGVSFFKQVKGRTVTTINTAGNEEHVATSYILNLTSGLEGGHVTLFQWTETNTTDFRYGLWFCRGSASAPRNYVDTCTLSVTLIEE